MKKLALFLICMAVCGSAFAGGSRPVKGTYAYCNYQVEESARKAGLKSPWGGGDFKAWFEFTSPLYNQCRCTYGLKPYEGQSC